MPKLKVLSGKAVCKILENYDFKLVRQKGSHMVMQKCHMDTTITVPVPDHRELKIGTLLSIIRQSQLPRFIFEET